MTLTLEQQKARLAKLTRTCPQCGAQFLSKTRTQKYCCLDCLQKWNKFHGKYVIKCENCGKILVEREQRRQHMCNSDCWKEYLAKLRARGTV